MRYSTLFFDLDETLYPSQCGVWDAIADRIDSYMLEILNFPAHEILPMRSQLFKQYGTTLKGLQAVCAIDPHHYLEYVHNVPLKDYLLPNHGLRQVLQKYPQRKVIFTNADRPHAERVIDALGLDGCFDLIVDIHDIAPHCKPEVEAYHIALQKAGDPQPANCVLLDDKVANLQAARQLGFHTILVGGDSSGAGEYDHIHRLEDLPTVFDPLQNDSKSVLMV